MEAKVETLFGMEAAVFIYFLVVIARLLSRSSMLAVGLWLLFRWDIGRITDDEEGESFSLVEEEMYEKVVMNEPVAGGKNIILVVRIEDRGEFARNGGVQLAVNVRRENIGALVEEATRDRDYHAFIEGTGAFEPHCKHKSKIEGRG